MLDKETLKKINGPEAVRAYEDLQAQREADRIDRAQTVGAGLLKAATDDGFIDKTTSQQIHTGEVPAVAIEQPKEK